MSKRIVIRHDTSSQWSLINPILLEGEMGLETDTKKHKIGDGTSPWNALDYSIAPVTSVAGKVGSVVLNKSDVGLSNVDNTSDANKPLSIATTNALSLKLDANKVGVANGVASLNGSGTIPPAQLPSYVDDVLEYTNLSSFPVTGETDKIYVALDVNKIYRWSGSTYIEISASPGSTDAVPEGSSNQYFTIARANAAVLPNLTTPNLIYVHPGTGSDTTGNGGAYTPYRTLAMAHASASTGDVIYLYPGLYTESTPTISKALTIRGLSPDSTELVNGVNLVTGPTWGGGRIEGINLNNLTINLSASSNAFLFIKSCAATFNRTDNVSSCLVSIAETNLNGGSISGSNTFDEVLLIGDMQVNAGLAYFENCKLVSQINAIGQTVVRLLDCSQFGPAMYSGTISAGHTPTLEVDESSNATGTFSGQFNKTILSSNTDSILEGTTNLYFTNARASAAAPVQSVAGKTGSVTLAKTDVGLSNVDNTSDINKPISSAVSTALSGKEPVQTKGSITSPNSAIIVTNGVSSTVGPNVSIDVLPVSASVNGLMNYSDKIKIDSLALDQLGTVSSNIMPTTAIYDPISLSATDGTYTFKVSGTSPLTFKVINNATLATTGSVSINVAVTGSVVSMVQSSNFVYFVTSTKYIACVDVSNKAAPVARGYFLISTAITPSDIAVDATGAFVYVAAKTSGSSAITGINFSNRDVPVSIASYSVTLNTTMTPMISTVGSVIWFRFGETATRWREFSYSINGSTGALTQIGTYGKGKCIVVNGTYAYTSISENPGSISVFDISSRYSPILRFAYTLPGGSNNGPQEMVVVGNYLYYASSAGVVMAIVDVTNPVAISLLSQTASGGASTSTPTTNSSIAVTDDSNYVYMAVQTNDADVTARSVTIFDATNKASPTVVGQIGYGTGSTRDLCSNLKIVGNYLFVALVNKTTTATKLDIYDISSPTAPVKLTATALSLSSLAELTMTVSPTTNYVYLADIGGSAGNMHIVDSTTKTAPTLISTFSPAAGFASAPTGIQVISDTWLYYNSGSTPFIDIFDIKVKSSPIKITRFLPNSTASGSFQVVRPYIYVNNRNNISMDVFTDMSPAMYSGDLTSSNLIASRTFQVPSLSTTQISAVTPAESMLVYDNVLKVTKYYNGTSWVAVNQYNPATSANWSGAAPTTISSALDRLAALLVTLNGGNPIP